MSATFKIAGRAIGPGQPTYVIAEISANHQQRHEHAQALVRAAIAAGADAVKLQTYTADTLTIACDRPCFRIESGAPWSGRTLHELYREASMPWDWQPRLQAIAAEQGVPLFSTPFDPTAVTFLARMGVPAYKVASFELVDVPLIERIARQGQPVIISTGMSDWDEITDAVAAARRVGNEQIALLKCTSAYPARTEDANLHLIPRLAERFGTVVGLSDHTLTHDAAVQAVRLGATIIEKHFTLRRTDGGPDAAFSLEPHEFSELVARVREAERMPPMTCDFKETDQVSSPAEQGMRSLRRSLFVVADIQAGELFTSENVRSIRPADGLPPKFLSRVLGERAARPIERGEPLTWDMIGEA